MRDSRGGWPSLDVCSRPGPQHLLCGRCAMQTKNASGAGAAVDAVDAVDADVGCHKHDVLITKRGGFT